MVHAPLRWEPIGELLDGNVYLMEQPSFVYQLEAELIQIFEHDDRQLGQWLDSCLDNLEANLDGQVDPDPLFDECARVFAGDSISDIPSADQSEEL